MKDFLGRELGVGDKVLYVSKPFDLRLTIGTVYEVRSDCIVVDRQFTNGYRPVRDGLVEVRNWDRKTPDEPLYFTKKARRTFVSKPGRITLLEKAAQ